MQLFCNYSATPPIVLAYYDDGVAVPNGAHPGATAVSYSGELSALGLVGNAPAIGAPDLRPFAAPALDLAAYAASVRYAKETGGFTWAGHPITTDEASQAKIGNAALGAQVVGSGFSTAWKGADGVFFTLDQTHMIAMATDMLAYVSGCYAAEAAIDAAITAGTITTTAEIDAYAWPSASAAS